MLSAVNFFYAKLPFLVAEIGQSEICYFLILVHCADTNVLIIVINLIREHPHKTYNGKFDGGVPFFASTRVIAGAPTTVPGK